MHAYYYEKAEPLENWETESNLMTLQKNTHYDLTFLGASNARVMSRSQNHLRVEEILQQKMANLAQGGGRGGPLKNYIYLSYFFEQGNRTEKIIYFVAPQTFYTEVYDSVKMDIEPFSLSFFLHAKEQGLSYSTLSNYMFSKLRINWSLLDHSEINTKHLNAVDERAVQQNLKRFKLNEEQHPANLEDKFRHIESIAELAKAQDSELLFVFPPLLMPSPHKQEVKQALEKLVNSHDAKMFDFSRSISEPKYFYDHTHLNSSGVELFTSNYLEPTIN